MHDQSAVEVSIPDDATSVSATASVRKKVGSRVTIYRNKGSEFWYAQWNNRGEMFRQSLKTKSVKQAQSLGGEIDRQLAVGHLETRTRRGPLISEIYPEYLKNLKFHERDNKSLELYDGYMRQFCHWAELQGIVRFDQVTVQVLEKFQQLLADSGLVTPPRDGGKPRKVTINLKTTIRNKMVNIRSAMAWALRRGLMQSDPAASYKLPSRSKEQGYCYSAKDLRAIFDHAESPYADIFELLSLTGLRVGEFIWLTKADVDFEKKMLHVRRKVLEGTGEKWHPKNGNARVVPLCPRALAIVQAAFVQSPSVWLFHASAINGSKGGRYGYLRLTGALSRAKKAGGVKSGKLHSFRHAFCSHMANSGVPALKVMRILGHSSLNIVLIYYHATDEELLSAIAGVDFDRMSKPEGGVEKGKN